MAIVNVIEYSRHWKARCVKGWKMWLELWGVGRRSDVCGWASSSFNTLLLFKYYYVLLPEPEYLCLFAVNIYIC